MPSFVGRWLQFLFGLCALLLVTAFTRGAWAFAGEHNVDGVTPTVGQYITTTNLVGGCPSCHTAPTKSFASINPNITVSGTGNSGSGASGATFFVQPRATATFTLTFNTNPAGGFGGSGGFLVFHDLSTGGSNDAQGLLGASTHSHSCLDGGGNPNGTTCGAVTNNNHEVMHSFPQTGGGGGEFFVHLYAAGHRLQRELSLHDLGQFGGWQQHLQHAGQRVFVQFHDRHRGLR